MITSPVSFDNQCRPISLLSDLEIDETRKIQALCLAPRAVKGWWFA